MSGRLKNRHPPGHKALEIRLFSTFPLEFFGTVFAISSAMIFKLRPAWALILASFQLFAQGSFSNDAFDLEQRKNLSQRLREVNYALEACSLHTSDSDVKDRGIADQIIKGVNEKSPDYQRPLNQDSIKIISSRFKTPANFERTDEIWKNINEVAFEKATKAIWATDLKLIGDKPFDKARAFDWICKYAPKLCSLRKYRTQLETTYLHFLEDLKKNPIKFMTGPEQSELLRSEFNAIIDRANNTCKITQEKYLAIKEEYNCKIRSPKDMNECDQLLEKAYQKHQRLQNLAANSIEISMERLINSTLGPLLLTEDLRNKVGVLGKDYVFENCMKGDGRVLNKVWHKDLLQARNDFFQLTLDEIQKIESDVSEDQSSGEKEDTIKQYLKTNPYTLSDLLLRKKDVRYVNSLCYYIDEIHSSDKTWQIVDGVVIGTGLVASIALGFTGIGSPAGVMLSAAVLGSTGYSVTKSTIDYTNQVSQDAHIRSSAATKQAGLDKAISDLKVSDEFKNLQLNNIKLTAITEVAGFGIGKGLKYLAVLKQSKKMAQMASLGGKILINETELVKNLERGSTLFGQSVKQLGPEASQFQKLSLEQEAKISVLFSNLDNVKSNSVTKSLAQLKSPAEIDKFLVRLENEIEQVRSSNFDLKLLKTLVDESKDSPTLYARSSVFLKSAPAEQKRLMKVTNDLKNKMKQSDEFINQKLLLLESRCIKSGALAKGCLQTQLTKIENEISAYSIEEYMTGQYQKILQKAKLTEQSLKNSQAPVVYDVVSIGGGYSNSVAVNVIKENLPNAKVLVIESTENMGAFHQVKGFNINTPEYLKASGNTLPGSPLQLKDFNIKKNVYTSAENLGNATQGSFQHADVDIIFQNKAIKATKEPAPGAWPAKYKIETDKGIVVYSRMETSGQGFGEPTTRLTDESSLNIVSKYQKAKSMKITAVDNMLPAATANVKAGKKAVDGFEKTTTLVVGAGDGGNIAVEALTGLNKNLNPTGAATNVKVVWLGQELGTGDELIKSLNARKIRRYGHLAKPMDSKQVTSVNGYLSKIEEFTDVNRKVKFKAFYATKEGTPVGVLEVDNIVFSTGYPNNHSHIKPIYQEMAKGKEIVMNPVLGRVDDYTRYDGFKTESPITNQVVIEGNPEDIYLVGTGAKVHVRTPEWDVPVGGSLDILAAKSAATGQMMAKRLEQLNPNLKEVSKTLNVIKDLKPQVFEVKFKPSLGTQTKIDDLKVAQIDIKLNLGKILRNFKTQSLAKFKLNFSRNSMGGYTFTTIGLDAPSSTILIDELAKNADLTHDLNSFFRLDKSSIEIGLATRGTGHIRMEDLSVVY